MAYMNSYRSAHSPPDEHSSFSPSLSSMPHSPGRNPNRVSTGTLNIQDARAVLTRRFTTNALPSAAPIGQQQQRRQMAGDYISSAAYSRLPPSERAADKYERLLAEQRRLQEQIDSIDPEARREVDEGRRHELAVSQMMAQSEPTTPPEYADVFPSMLRGPNRYSSSSLTSPPGLVARQNRASVQITSPPGLYRFNSAANNIPSQSVPGSRRHSDDEDDEGEFLYDFDIHRAAANPNRNSMPITSYDRKRNTLGDVPGALGALNTPSLLFLDEGKPSKRASQPIPTSPPNGKTFLHLQQTADGFPKLIRREDTSELPLSDSSAALDLALANISDPEQQVNERSAARNRTSLPPGAYTTNAPSIAGLNGILATANEAKLAASNRRSMEVKFATETKRPGLVSSPPRSEFPTNGVAKPQPSYSTNDIPTLKSMKGDTTGSHNVTSPPAMPVNIANATSPQQNPPASAPRGPSGGPTQQSQDFPPHTSTSQESINPILAPHSGLQPSATSFGPSSSERGQFQPPFPSTTMNPYGQAQYYNTFGVPILNSGFANMNVSGTPYNGQAQPQGQAQWAGPVNPFQNPNFNSGYGQYANGGQAVAGAARFADGQRSVMAARRQQTDDANARFNSIHVKDLIGEIHTLCKDQHGCRFLQRKLEERSPETVQVIFNEVKGHIIELMTDPFGNYLCQKLLESANNDQRTVLIHNAMPAMTSIALNQHGTRALQKMIEFISTPEQTQMIIEALRFDVVKLIQDLNGNHVIQKCLNHLSSEDAQFIFDAVGSNCVTVGTHRHGCCVLQRCIDHASGVQKGDLIRAITSNSYSLVQDPFGNYVVQYILDLNEPAFTEPLCAGFAGNIAFLSKQKFSSNVMEKCLRCAQGEARRKLIMEILPPQELEKLLRDSYANYVVQTALDFADDNTKANMVENIRPILPAIRNTPYGRRIQTKVSDYDSKNAGAVQKPVGMASLDGGAPNGAPTLPFGVQSPPTGRGNRMGFIGSPPNWGGPAAFANLQGTANQATPAPNFTTPPSWSGGNGTKHSSNIASPTPQRNNQAYTMLNGGNDQTNSFGGSPFGGIGSNGNNGF